MAAITTVNLVSICCACVVAVDGVMGLGDHCVECACWQVLQEQERGL